METWRACLPCAVSWVGDPACWSCGGPSTAAQPPVLNSQHGARVVQPEWAAS